MSEEMKKIDLIVWMFNNLTSQHLEALKNMARAMTERPEPVTEKKRPPLND
jgi:hypothetical protein